MRGCARCLFTLDLGIEEYGYLGNAFVFTVTFLT